MHHKLSRSPSFQRALKRVEANAHFMLYYGVIWGYKDLCEKIAAENGLVSPLNLQTAAWHNNGNPDKDAPKIYFYAELHIPKRKRLVHLMAPIHGGGVEVTSRHRSSNNKLEYFLKGKDYYEVRFECQDLLMSYLNRLHTDFTCRKLLGLGELDPNEPVPALPWNVT